MSEIQTEAQDIIRRAEDRSTRTFMAHGMNHEDITEGAIRYRAFLKRQVEVERAVGMRPFDTPLAKDVFILGWWQGRQEGRTDG